MSKCPFAMHVAEKLLQLDQRNKAIAEKRINDIFFDIEMNGRNSFQSPGPLMHPISLHTSDTNTLLIQGV